VRYGSPEEIKEVLTNVNLDRAAQSVFRRAGTDTT
jgi:hypothetical protein